MIEEGLLDRYGAPDAAFAIHISPNDASGEVSTRPGALMAGASLFKIVVKGRGGHPAQPHHALDPIPIAAEIVLALQSYVTRRVKAFEPAVVTVTALQAGSYEVGAIPETAVLTGTIGPSRRRRSRVCLMLFRNSLKTSLRHMAPPRRSVSTPATLRSRTILM